MESLKPYENFPAAKVVPAVLLNVSIYALGASILSGFGIPAAVLYLFYCLGAEINVMRTGCVDCFYYGKWCAFGKGKAAPLLFKRGDPARFPAKSMSWKDLLPDMLVAFVPLAGGITLLIQRFSWGVTLMLALLLVLAFQGTSFVRSKMACKYCKQRELGCPAERFFSKRQS